MTEKFKIGDHVVKVRGYLFPGIIRSVFTNLRGEYRVVVQCTAIGAEGMLHIFNFNQIRKRPAVTYATPDERSVGLGSKGAAAPAALERAK